MYIQLAQKEEPFFFLLLKRQAVKMTFFAITGRVAVIYTTLLIVKFGRVVVEFMTVYNFASKVR